MAQLVRIHRVWLDALTEASGPWPVIIDAQLPQSAQIVDVALAWRDYEDPSIDSGPYPCLRYIEDGAEADEVSRLLYAVQDGGEREIPDDAEWLGVIRWDASPVGVHLFGVRGPVDVVGEEPVA